MFPSRRPVPSKAALRVLRQLAYISSGTACGAAALVAEERRRQTCVAKRIVETARTLKQHPRYAHHAAPPPLLPDNDYAAFDSSDPFASYGDGEDALRDNRRNQGNEYSHSSASGYHLARRKRQKVLEPEVIRSDVLPSEVAAGYDRWVERQSKREPRTSTQPGQTRPPPKFGDQSTRRVPPTKTNAAQQTAEWWSPFPVAGSDPRPRVAHWSEHKPDKKPREQGHGRGFLRSLDPKKLSAPRLSAHDALAKRCDNFLALHAQKPLDDPLDKSEALLRALKLLQSAMDSGQLDDARKLAQWLLARKHISESQLQHLCGSIKTFSAKNDSQAIHTFYNELLLHEHVRSLNAEMVTKCKLQIVTNLTAESTNTLPTRIDTTLFDCFMKDQPVGAAVPALEETCTQLTGIGRVETAIELFLHFVKSLNALDSCMDLANKLLDMCIQKNNPVSSQRLLNFLDGHGQEIGPAVGKWILLSSENGHAHQVIAIYDQWHTRCNVPAEVYDALFLALLETHSPEAALLVSHHLALPLRDELLIACKSAWNKLLQRQWRITSNPQSVRETYRAMCRLAGESGVDPEVRTAMLQTGVLSIREVELKRDVLETRGNRCAQHDFKTAGLLVLCAAKSQDWALVDQRLASISGRKLTTGTSKDSSKSDMVQWVDLTINEFAQKHTSEETVTFATKTIDQLDIVPTPATFSIVLEALVHCDHNHTSKISGWIDYVRRAGLEIRINAENLVDVLKRYYYDFRPSFTRLKALVTAISRDASHLLSQELYLLLRDAAGYDLRSHDGHKNARAARIEITEDIEKLEKRILEFSIRKVDPDDHKASRPFEPDSADMDIGLDPRSLSHKNEARRLYMGKRKAKTEMLMALSLSDPSEAIKLHQRMLSASGLPSSSVSLDMAIEASLRTNNGDPQAASLLIAEAEEAGMNVVSTLVPMLQNHIRNLPPAQRQDAEALSATVMAFYRAMDEAGIRVSHNVGVTAAHVLLLKNPHKALNLLRAIYFSPWAAARPLDIVPMTLFLQGYVALAHRDGARWVVDEVLKKNMRIDRRFIGELGDAAKGLVRLATPSTGRGVSARAAGPEGDKIMAFAEEMLRWRDECRVRQRRQIVEAQRVGEAIVRCLIKESNKLRNGPAVEGAKR